MKKKTLQKLVFTFIALTTVSSASWAVTGSPKEEKESRYYDTEAFTFFDVFPDEFELTILEMSKTEGINIITKNYEVFVPLKNGIEFTKPWFGPKHLTLPKGEFYGALVRNTKTLELHFFEDTFVTTHSDEIEYRATSETGQASVYTDLKGGITRVAVLLEKTPGAIEEVMSGKKEELPMKGDTQ